RRKVVQLLTAEGLIVAAAGSLAGMAAGVGYAALMVFGLRTWWLAAVVTPFLRLYVTPWSLALGFLSGLVLAVLAIWWSVRQAARTSPRRLMAGTVQSEDDAFARPSRWPAVAGQGLLVVALLLGLAAGRIGEELQAGAFFGAGALVLIGLMLMLRGRLRTGATGAAVTVGGGNLARLAVRSAARNAGRSTLCVGLVASATFLIVSVSAFHLDPTQGEPSLPSGDGGFALVAESTQPIFHDLNSAAGRAALGFSPEQEELLRPCNVITLRVQPGDNASCLNLYQARQPRILGIPAALAERGGFAWAETAASTPAERENPWLLLEPAARPTDSRESGADEPVAMALEKNMATYALHLYGGVGEIFPITDSQGRTVKLQIAAMLTNSILQGDLLISERQLLRRFPDVTGYRFFLITAPGKDTAAVRRELESVLGDYGFAAEPTGQRLAGFLAVQNTYLSTFQSLGGLGLLLGTFGLAVVQMRSVFERRAELALLRAAGFRRRRLAVLVLLENASLLLAGLGVGLLAALVAVFPHLVSRTAAVPFGALAGTLVLVLVTGLAAGALAVRAALRTPLLPALRQERG
ncbi:MAG: FtsX-like permease family protein, partial [Patescibacteria group bacterium]|nr:FtsX-like permease family protein [Patescibacteria group bacterium]